MKSTWRHAKATQVKRVGLQKTDRRSPSPLPSAITVKCLGDGSQFRLDTARAVSASCPGCGTLYRYVHPHIETRPAEVPAALPA